MTTRPAWPPTEPRCWAGAFTKPESGSNIAAIKTKAERKGDSYLLTGQKVYISQVGNASHIVVMARTSPYDEAHKTRGISLLLGHLPDPAVKAHPFKKLGNHFMDTNRVYFTGYEVPAENLVGKEGGAWRALYDILNPERIVFAATAVGTGILAIRKAVEYASEPVAQGRLFCRAAARPGANRRQRPVRAVFWYRGPDRCVAAYGPAHRRAGRICGLRETQGGALPCTPVQSRPSALQYEDMREALTEVNRCIERCIEVDTEQYLWAYKRLEIGRKAKNRSTKIKTLAVLGPDFTGFCGDQLKSGLIWVK